MKRLIRLVLIVLVLVVGAVAAAPFLIPSATIADYAADVVRAETGRELAIEGDIGRSVFPSIGLKTGRASLSNAPWAAEPALAAVDGLEVKVALWPLLLGRVEIEQLTVIRPTAHLEVNADGAESWAFDAPADQQPSRGGASAGASNGEGAAAAAPFALKLDNVAIIDGALTYLDVRQGQTLRLDEIAATVSMAAIDAPLLVEGSALWNGEKASLTAVVETLAAAQRGEPVLAGVALRAPGAEIAFQGSGAAPQSGDAPRAEGSLSIALDGDPAVTGWLRQSLPPSLAPLGAVSLSGDFAASDAALSLDFGGHLGFAGQRTEIVAKASAGAGWMSGTETAKIDLSAKNAILDAGYAGAVGLGPDGTPRADGAYRVKAPDAQALLGWSTAATGAAAADLGPVSQLQTIDIAGAVRFADTASASLDGAIGFNGRRLALTGAVDGAEDWSAGGPIQTQLSAVSDGLVDLDWSGAVTLVEGAPSIDGRIDLDAPKLRALADWAGAGPIAAPKNSFQSLAIGADIAYGGGRAALMLERLALDAVASTGEITADLSGAKPFVSVKLATGPLDIRPFTAAGGASGDGASAPAETQAAEGWSDAPIDVSALRMLDAEFDILADAVTTDTLKLGRTKITGALKDGRLDATLTELGLYGGGAKGEAVIDASGAEPVIDAKIDADAVQMLPFLRDLSGVERLEGLGRVRMDVTGAGGSMRALMRSLNGDGQLLFADGALLGFNLAAMMRNIGSAFTDPAAGETRKTDFAELAGSFKIVGGVATNPDLRLLGPLLRLSGAGDIDLGAQTLNYRLIPRAVATLEGQGGAANASGLAFPLIITGSWSNPSIRPDLEGAIQGILENPEGAIDGVKALIEGGAKPKDLIGGVLNAVSGGAQPAEAPPASAAPAEAAPVQKPVNPLQQILKGVQDGGDGGKPQPEKLLKGLFGN